MDMRMAAVHAPALSLHEAAMLPALSAARDGMPRNLLTPVAGLEFRQGSIDQHTGMGTRRGTMAGRALLTYVKSAPAQRQRRW